MSLPGQRSEVRLTELVALLSLGTDLGLGQPMDHMSRACLIAPGLAECMEMMRLNARCSTTRGCSWVGCHTDAYEQAKWLGDDLSLKSDAHYAYDFGRVGPVTAFMVKHVGGASKDGLQPRVGVGLVRRQQRGTGHPRLARKRGHERGDARYGQTDSPHQAAHLVDAVVLASGRREDAGRDASGSLRRVRAGWNRCQRAVSSR